MIAGQIHHTSARKHNDDQDLLRITRLDYPGEGLVCCRIDDRMARIETKVDHIDERQRHLGGADGRR